MQSKWGSVLETIAGTAIGFVLSWLVGYVVFPLYGFSVTGSQNFQIVAIFTVTSLLRSYGVRRLFNWLHMRKDKHKAEMKMWGVRVLGDQAFAEYDAMCAKLLRKSLRKTEKDGLK